MTREERAKQANFASIMERHASAERRTLADLHEAGFRFKSVREAWQYAADSATRAAAAISSLAEQLGRR